MITAPRVASVLMRSMPELIRRGAWTIEDKVEESLDGALDQADRAVLRDRMRQEIALQSENCTCNDFENQQD